MIRNENEPILTDKIPMAQFVFIQTGSALLYHFCLGYLVFRSPLSIWEQWMGQSYRGGNDTRSSRNQPKLNILEIGSWRPPQAILFKVKVVRSLLFHVWLSWELSLVGLRKLLLTKLFSEGHGTDS